MTVSIAIPAFNEATTLPLILEGVVTLDIPGKQIIVVDDGSTDETSRLLTSWVESGIEYIRLPENQGKGAALRAALEIARGEFFVVQDADLEYDPSDIPSLLDPLCAGFCNVVYGSRILLWENPRGYLSFYVGGRLVTALANLLYGLRLTDLTTGYKAFRTSLLRSLGLQINGFGFCAEVTALLALRGEPIHEVPIHYYPRSFSEGKKITWRDGVESMRILIAYRLGRRPTARGPWPKSGAVSGQGRPHPVIK